MIRFFAILILSALGNGHSAPAGSQDEIRYTRMESFGRTVSMLIIRPDSLVLRKYTAHPREKGDTIGIFKLPSNRKRFDSLWAWLEKGKSAKGIAMDAKVIVIEGRKNKRAFEFLVPVRPPIPEWASTFNHRIGELHALAERAPFSSITLKERIEANASVAVIDSLWLENPGKAVFARTAGCTIAIEGAQFAVSSRTRAIKWVPMADSGFSLGISLEPQARMPMRLGFPSPGSGKWYFRAKWSCESDSKAEGNPYREEVFSPLDSMEIGPG